MGGGPTTFLFSLLNFMQVCMYVCMHAFVSSYIASGLCDLGLICFVVFGLREGSGDGEARGKGSHWIWGVGGQVVGALTILLLRSSRYHQTDSSRNAHAMHKSPSISHYVP